MAKKRKLKKSAALLIGILGFFVIYFIAFNFGKSLDKQTETNPKKAEETEDTRSLLTQISSKNKIYVSDKSEKSVDGVKIEERYWDEIKYSFKEFSGVRSPESYDELYVGYSDDGIRFSTDLNFFRVYTVNKEEYYKVPVMYKKEFENLIKKSIYTSFDFIKQYKAWDKVNIIYGDKTKSIPKWKYDKLSYQMAAKRMVGKVQPEKNKERSKYNFVINVKGKSYEAKMETMGKDYVKITCKGEEAYYEVNDSLFEYIRDEIFKIEE